MVFNVEMTDTELIDRLGGDTAVAKRLGWPSLNGARRVHNWRRRGIPAAIKLEYPWLNPKSKRATSQAGEAAHG